MTRSRHGTGGTCLLAFAVIGVVVAFQLSMHGGAEHVPLAAIVEASQVLFEAVRDTLAK